MSTLLESLLARVREGAPIPAELERRWRANPSKLRLEAMPPAEQMLFVTLEAPEVDRAIDRALESPHAAAIADRLVRAGVPWSHPALEALLDDDGGRFAAACLLADDDPEALEAWLDACEVVEDAFDAARAAATIGAVELRDAIRTWAQASRQEALGDWAARFEALVAILDTRFYARQVVLGEMDAGWLRSPELVADYLQAHGFTEWIEPLAILTGDAAGESEAAAEFAAMLAISASYATNDEQWDGARLARYLEMLARARADASGKTDASVAEALASSGDFGLQVAFGEDDDLVLLLAEAAIHERLVALGEPSPGIGGLVLSASDREAVDLDAARAFFDQELPDFAQADEALVVWVRTLVDLRQWYEREPEAFGPLARHATARLADCAHPAIALAAARLQDRLDERPLPPVDALARQARGEGLTHLDALRQLAERATPDAIEALAGLWVDGPPARAWAYRDAVPE